MIIDTDAHALDAAFLDALCRNPAFGLSAEGRADGRFWVRRGDGVMSTNSDDISQAACGVRIVKFQLERAFPPGLAEIDEHTA